MVISLALLLAALPAVQPALHQSAPPKALSAQTVPTRGSTSLASDVAPAGGLFSANQLRQRCVSTVAADASYCFAYITGVHDTVRAYEAWLNQREFCVPRHVPQGDLRAAFINYVRDHSSDLSGEAASVVVVALKIRYPCIAADRSAAPTANRATKP